MPQNNSQVRVVDPILSNVAQGYQHTDHVGMTLFPRVPVLTSGGKIIEFNKDSFKLLKMRRTPGSHTKRIQYGHEGKSFALVQDALEGLVPRENLRDAAAVPNINLATRAVNGTMSSMSLSLEYEQSQLATNAANYDRNHTVALSSADRWDKDGSIPGKDIEMAREAIRSSTGIYPNTIVIAAQVLSALRNNSTILERFKYTSKESITVDMLAALWGFDHAVVGKAVAFDDAGKSIDMWGKGVVIAYVPPAASNMEEPSYGYTYTMEGHPLVEEPYYDQNAKSWIYPTTYERIPVQSGITSGFYIASAVD